jgi:hypothetical protein
LPLLACFTRVRLGGNVCESPVFLGILLVSQGRFGNCFGSCIDCCAIRGFLTCLL